MLVCIFTYLSSSYDSSSRLSRPEASAERGKTPAVTGLDGFWMWSVHPPVVFKHDRAKKAPSISCTFIELN